MTTQHKTRRAPLWLQLTAQLFTTLFILASFLLGPALLAWMGWGMVLLVSFTLVGWAIWPSYTARYRRP